VVIRRYVEQQARRAGLDCTLELDAAPSNLSEDTMLLCYRCVQEAVTNIVKHSKARRITVVLERHDAEVHLRIEDDGEGFELPAQWRVSEQGGLGVPGMAERFRLAGGEFALESSPGFGTRVLASIPIDPRNAAVA
jgi:signal transduction histidine kinase